VARQVPETSRRAVRVLAQAELGTSAGVADHFAIFAEAEGALVLRGHKHQAGRERIGVGRERCSNSRGCVG